MVADLEAAHLRLGQSTKPSLSSSLPLLQISSARSTSDDSVMLTWPSLPAWKAVTST